MPVIPSLKSKIKPLSALASGIVLLSLTSAAISQSAESGPDDVQAVKEIPTKTSLAWTPAEAIRELKLVVEPGGAAALAAVLSGAFDVEGRMIGLVLSGGNIDPETLLRCLKA